MQQVVFEQPYEFVPPSRSNIWPTLVQLYLPRYLRKTFLIESVENRHAERLRASLDEGHGILLAPNHCRDCDPLVLGPLVRECKTHVFAMASWHLFMQDRFIAFMVNKMGAFSVYREGMDRKAISTAIEILASAERPLIIFPEGARSRHNDKLMALMDGVAFMARSAAKRRAKESGGKVVVHPVAIRYYFRGNLEQSLDPVLTDIEHRLSWLPQNGEPLLDRIRRVGEALLSLKEIEYLGRPRPGNLFQRVRRLIDHLLAPLERRYKIQESDGSVIARVKRLRGAILPDLIENKQSEAERQRRWRELAQCYYAQQMSYYPEEYLSADDNIPEHVLETVERFDEDLTDNARVHGPMHAVVEVGESIDVATERPAKGQPDPLMAQIEEQLNSMLTGLAAESRS